MEVTIEITDYCTYDCDYCSTNAGVHGIFLDIATPNQKIYRIEKTL